MSDADDAFAEFLEQLTEPRLPSGRVLAVERGRDRLVLDLRDAAGNDSQWLIEFREGAEFRCTRID